MADEIPASVLSVIMGRFDSLEKRLGDYLTIAAFQSDRERVTGKLDDLGSDIRNETLARSNQASDIRSEIKTAQDKADSASAATESRKVSFRQGLTITLIGVLTSGVLGLIVLIIQNASHLTGN